MFVDTNPWRVGVCVNVPLNIGNVKELSVKMYANELGVVWWQGLKLRLSHIAVDQEADQAGRSQWQIDSSKDAPTDLLTPARPTS